MNVHHDRAYHPQPHPIRKQLSSTHAILAAVAPQNSGSQMVNFVRIPPCSGPINSPHIIFSGFPRTLLCTFPCVLDQTVFGAQIWEARMMCGELMGPVRVFKSSCCALVKNAGNSGEGRVLTVCARHAPAGNVHRALRTVLARSLVLLDGLGKIRLGVHNRYVPKEKQRNAKAHARLLCSAVGPLILFSGVVFFYGRYLARAPTFRT